MVSLKERMRAAALTRCMLRALLLFPDEAWTLSSSNSSSWTQHRTLVRNTFLEVVEGAETDQSSRPSSEPKDFKPASDSFSSELHAPQAAAQVRRSSRQTASEAACTDGEASDTNVPSDIKLTPGSCLDRSCTTPCILYHRGSCRHDKLCRHCHLCTAADAAAERKRRRKQMMKQAELNAQAAAKKGQEVQRTLPSLGSCQDGACGNGCAWHLERQCKKGSSCSHCHVCPPSEATLNKRCKLEYYQTVRQQHKAWKKDKKLRRSIEHSQSLGVSAPAMPRRSDDDGCTQIAL